MTDIMNRTTQYHPTRKLNDERPRKKSKKCANRITISMSNIHLHFTHFDLEGHSENAAHIFATCSLQRIKDVGGTEPAWMSKPTYSNFIEQEESKEFQPFFEPIPPCLTVGCFPLVGTRNPKRKLCISEDFPHSGMKESTTRGELSVRVAATTILRTARE
ncbi:hypothetical protein J3R30DRAFT_1097415 [Lentinula aciculospora]|uniref:Uncharacterized protein n=1 Tax=Lentinula aciculospora TaxID=153920 RepID=A0A9W9DI09_9AGAR|nr:hypothetical protein J3R30DRAFT_1097415 [Lentinula aciculospora]